MPERLNGAVSKTVEPARVPRVRIPLSPPRRRERREAGSRRDARAVESARLEIACGSKGHRGFESLSLRHRQGRGGHTKKRTMIGGDVAQLGERLVRNEEVGGSSPLISTILEHSLPRGT